MSNRLQGDIEYAMSILNNECQDQFRKIFINTNEKLLPLFDNLDLTNKDILTVLSSSDYLYMSYLYGAKNVDCFDINPLTYRFFHLRKWLISNGIMDIVTTTYGDVCKVLEKTKINTFNSEKESLIFWEEILKVIGKDSFHDNQLFIPVVNFFNYFYKDKMEILSKKLSHNNMTFYNIDISNKNILNSDNQYDYIFLSNIIDYNRNSESLDNIVHNLIQLTNSNGKVVCAHIARVANEDFSQELDLERKYFQDYFEYSDIICDELNGNRYYQYIKK